MKFYHSNTYGKLHAIIILYCLLQFCLLSNKTHAQTHTSDTYAYFMFPDTLQQYVRFLTSDEAEGRATGSKGSLKCAEFIANTFKDAGLEPYQIGYFQRFNTDGKTGINIIGKISATIKSNEYIIVGAHYDHRGNIDGQIYRGADDNASGTAALISIAKAFGKMKQDGKTIEKNILFVAFDGKELSMSGSKDFVANIKISTHKILEMINIDQIGTSLEAPGKNKDYILVLGNEYLKEWESKQLNFCNIANGLHMDIDYSFYKSDTFKKLFYKLSDQNSFAEKNIPAMIFTAGINNHTYKTSDTELIIEYPILSKRALLIYYFLYQLVS